MRILHVLHDAAPYGIRTFVLSLTRYQREWYGSKQVGVAFQREHPDTRLFEELNVPVHVMMRNRARDIRLLWDFKAVTKLYDVVNLHTHSPWALLGARLGGAKIVFVFHGAFGFGRGWLAAPLRSYYLHVLNRHSEKITFASETSKRMYEDRLGCRVEADKGLQFAYGLDVATLKASRERQEVRRELNIGDEWVVGTAARMDPMKRIERLIEAFGKMRGDSGARLILMGSGDLCYERFLRQVVADRGLSPFVMFLGYRADAIDVLSALDLFVLPSAGEPFGLALIEAMALGIPCAVFRDGGGCVEILSDAEMTADSVVEMSEIMARTLSDKGWRKRASAVARSRAEAFDISKAAQHFDRAYLALLEKR